MTPDHRSRIYRRWLVALALALPILTGLAPHAFADDPPNTPPDDERQVLAYAIKLDGSAFLGVQPTELTPELRRHFGVDEDTGVLVAKVVEDSPAAAAGVAVGDILTAVDGQPVRRPVDLRRAVGKHGAGDTVPVVVWRDGRRLELGVTLAEREAGASDHEFHFEHLPQIRMGKVIVPEGFDIQIDPESFDFEGFDPEDLEELSDELNQMFDSDEWRETLGRFEAQRGDMGERLQELEKQLHELEEQLHELRDQPDNR